MNKRRSLLLCTKRRVQESNNLNLCNRCDETFHFPFPPIYFKFPKRFYGLISSSFQQDRISSARSGYGRVFPLRLHIAFNSSVKSDYWLLKKTQEKKNTEIYILVFWDSSAVKISFISIPSRELNSWIQDGGSIVIKCQILKTICHINSIFIIRSYLRYIKWL